MARLSYAYFVEPGWLETNSIELSFPHLDPALVGLRILHLTDFHLGTMVPATHIRQAIDLARRQPADLVALTGDFIHAGHRHVGAIAKMLSRFSAPLGVYAVLGNHDYSVRVAGGVRQYPRLAASVTRALTEEGIQVLHNEHRLLENNGSRLALAGVADAWSKESDLSAALDGIPDEIPRIVLAHNPSSLESLAGRRCDLMLSGHTHGGQIHLPGLGPAMLSAKARRHAAGLYRHPSGYLYVNKGVGYSLRFRYKVRPEVVVVSFREGNMDEL